MNALYRILCLGGLLVAAPLAMAQEGAGAGDTQPVKADSLGELLRNVEDRRIVESREHVQREQRFQNDKTGSSRVAGQCRIGNDAPRNGVPTVWKPNSRKMKSGSWICRSNSTVRVWAR